MRRKVFGVYAVLFLAFVVLGVELMFLGFTISDMFHRIYKLESVLMGLASITLSSLTFYFLPAASCQCIWLTQNSDIGEGGQKRTYWRREIPVGISFVVGGVIFGLLFNSNIQDSLGIDRYWGLGKTAITPLLPSLK